MAGANLTINAGSFASNSVMGGTGFVDGSAYGAALFLGADVTFNISNNLTLESLGGAGNTSDPNVKQYNPLTPQNNAALDPNAQGGIIKTGAATLTMTGSNYYTGATVIHQGTVALGSGAIEQGTSEVIVGQNGGDNATLVLGSSSILDVFSGTNSAVMLGQNAGSTGTVVIGSGVGSSGAYIGANIIQGGVGGGSVVFEQEFAAGSNAPSIYPFYLQLTGNLQVIQNGPGTTLLSPDPNGNGNTFTGGLVINNGTVILNAPPLEEYGWALPIGSSVTINTNGALNLGGAVQGNAPSAGSVVLNGGSVYGGYFDVGTLQATSGNIAAYLVTDVFVQNGTGTVTITNSGYLHAGNLFDFMNPTNVAFINSGTLIVGGGSGLNFAGADMIVGSHSGSAPPWCWREVHQSGHITEQTLLSCSERISDLAEL
jgi:autotransporter-associated beta strand protein